MKEITVIVAGLPYACSFTVGYETDKSDKENALSALIKSAMLARREIDKKITSSEQIIHIADTEDSGNGKQIYEVVFELNDGKKILGYSDLDEPSTNGDFYHCAANKDLKGRVIVAAKNVIISRFTPL